MSEGNQKPIILGTWAGDQIQRSYSLTLNHFANSPDGEHQDYSIYVHIHRYLRMVSNLSDGSLQAFSEGDDACKPSYVIVVHTDRTFPEAINFFRDFGVSQEAQILRLVHHGLVTTNYEGNPWLYEIVQSTSRHSGREFVVITEPIGGDSTGEFTSYDKEPLVFRELDEGFVEEIAQSNNIFLCLWSPVEDSKLQGIKLWYEKRTSDKEGTKYRIAYCDGQFVKPRFEQVLALSPIRLNDLEKRILENFIVQGLQL